MLLITRPESSARSTFVEPDWIRLIAFVLAIVNHSFLILVYVFLQANGAVCFCGRCARGARLGRLCAFDFRGARFRRFCEQIGSRFLNRI